MVNKPVIHRVIGYGSVENVSISYVIFGVCNVIFKVERINQKILTLIRKKKETR